MAKAEPTSQGGDASILEKGMGALERAWEAQWALRLVCLVLFFDMAMLWHSHRGVWQLAGQDKPLLHDAGWIVLTFVAFSFIAAIVLPVILMALRQILFTVMIWLSTLIPGVEDERPYRRPVGFVPARALHDLALEQKDEFLLRMYENHKRQKWEDETRQHQAGELTAAALLAALADWLVGQATPGSISLVASLVKALDGLAPFAIAAVLLCAGIILKSAWFSIYAYKPNLIYYPPLDRELRVKEDNPLGPR